MMTLYSYFRSSAAFRVRIALNYKNVPYEIKPVHLLRDGGEQLRPAYKAINPQGLVPALIDQGIVLTQSLAIIGYLEELYPTPALLPQTTPIARAQVRAFALAIACEMHPLNNRRVWNYLSDPLELDEEKKIIWYHHWLREGFTALEKMLTQAGQGSCFCFNDSFSIADVCLIPQVYNAHRFKFDMQAFPLLEKIYQHCLNEPYVMKAHPDAQPDAE